MTEQHKKPDQKIAPDRYVINAEIVRKGIDGDFYVRRSIADYRIDVHRSSVSHSALQKQVATDLFHIKMTTMEIGYIDGPDGSPHKEVIIYKMNDT